MRSIVLALSLLLPGCALATGTEGAREYEGIYEAGFEVSSFRRCDSDERWWVTGGTELWTRYHEVARDYEPVYVRVTGVRSGSGRFGHMGAYTREFEVREVLEIRKPAAGECGVR